MNIENNYGISDWHRAVLGGPNAFGGNYIKYVEARFPGDIDAQESFLQKSIEGRDFHNQLDQRLKLDGLNGGVLNLIDGINIKVIELMKGINVYVK